MASTAARARVAERSEAARRRILEAAGALFSERGYGGASVDQIAARAGVNKAMLYYYVGGKEELFSEVLVTYVEGVRRELLRAASSTSDPKERIRRMVQTVLAVFERDPALPGLLVREIAAARSRPDGPGGGASESGHALPDAVVAKVAEVVRITHDVVADGLARGELREVHPFLVHVLVVGASALLVNARPVRSRMERGRKLPPQAALTAADMARELSEIVLFGISKTRRSGGRG